MKRFIVPLLFILFINTISANIIKGKFENCKFDYLIFSKYYFSEKIFVDTIFLEKGKFEYKYDKLETGMYNLKFDKTSIDIIINNENISFYYNCKSSDNVKFSNSEENKILSDFFNFYSDNNLAYNLLRKLEDFYPQSDEFYQDIVKRKEILKQKNNNYIDSINKKYKKLYAPKIISLYKINDNEFLDDSEFYNTNLKNSSFLGDLLISYINKFQKQNYSKAEQEKAFESAIKQIFKSFSKNSELCIYVADYLIDQFRYYDFEQTSEFIAEQLEDYANDYKKTPELEKKYNNIIALINLRIGNKAPDFKINDKLNLYDVDAEYKVVIFWASWCPHCEELINKILSKNMYLADNVKIITYSLDYEKTEWNDVIKNFPSSWLNRCMCDDADESIPDSYAIYSTPSVFLLNKNDYIVAKPKTLEDIENLIYKKN